MFPIDVVPREEYLDMHLPGLVRWFVCIVVWPVVDNYSGVILIWSCPVLASIGLIHISYIVQT